MATVESGIEGWGGRIEAARFWDRVRIGSRLDCWPWTGTKTDKGYGQLKLDGRAIGAHRISWALHRSPIPDGLQVLHRCDNPSCVNPAHLFLGTPADNMADMVAKGRQKPKAKLTAAQVVAIRGDKRLQKHIAADYGVTLAAISHIKTGRRWPRLEAA